MANVCVNNGIKCSECKHYHFSLEKEHFKCYAKPDANKDIKAEKKENIVLTVEELFAECLVQIKKGNGRKEIQISRDDEGNGFHSLFFGFTFDKETIESYGKSSFHDNVDLDNIVLLG